MSAQDKILEYLLEKAGEWHPTGNLQRMEWKNEDGTLAIPRTVQRRLQNLEEKSLIAVQYEGKSCKYRYIPEKYRPRYIPSSKRPIGQRNVLWKKDGEITTAQLVATNAERLAWFNSLKSV